VVIECKVKSDVQQVTSYGYNKTENITNQNLSVLVIAALSVRQWLIPEVYKANCEAFSIKLCLIVMQTGEGRTI